MNKRDINHDYNEDNPHVLDMLMKEIVKQEDDQVILGNRLMMLCQVNQAWKAAVDRYFSRCEALTIEVFFSKPTDFEEEAEEVNNTLSILHNEEFTHVQDIAGEFDRLSALSQNDVAFEVKGPLLRVHFERLPALLCFFREGAGVDYQTGEPLQMKTRTLSLVIIDRYRHQRTGPSVVGDPLDAYQPLLDLEALFSPAHLEVFYLTVRLSELLAFFLNSLMNGLVERRRGGALHSFDLHIPQLTIPKESPLLLLIPQLEHFGVHCRGLFDARPLLEVTVSPKLRSLKLPDPLCVPLNSVVPLLARLTTLELSFWVSSPKVNTLLSHCRALVSLKLNRGSHSFNYINFKFLRPLGRTLRHLTLVNFNLNNIWESEPVELSRVITLTVVNNRHLLYDFENWKQPFKGKQDFPGQLVGRLDEVLFRQFPGLKQLTLIGAIFDHRNVQQQLTERLVARPGGRGLTQLQMHFVEQPNRRKLSWKRPID